MWGWIAHCFDNYAVFKGRASRPEFWWFSLFGMVTNLAMSWLVAPPSPLAGIGFIKYLWSAIIYLPNLAVASRRLHDTGHSLWWLIIPQAFIAPLVIVALTTPAWIKGRIAIAFLLLLGALVAFGLGIRLLVLYCRKGDAGPNRYGDPAPTTPG
jgi:uncharacterized membrane protein YhaH (DUF805 family)